MDCKHTKNHIICAIYLRSMQVQIFYLIFLVLGIKSLSENLGDCFIKIHLRKCIAQGKICFALSN